MLRYKKVLNMQEFSKKFLKQNPQQKPLIHSFCLCDFFENLTSYDKEIFFAFSNFCWAR